MRLDMTPKICRRTFLTGSSVVAGLAAVAPRALSTKTAKLRVGGLKVDNLDRPLGLENLQPRLSWQLQSDARNVRQTAYHVLVASSRQLLKRGRGNLWDSDRITSEKLFGIQY